MACGFSVSQEKNAKAKPEEDEELRYATVTAVANAIAQYLIIASLPAF